MYREMSIPRLHAALWISEPDRDVPAAGSPESETPRVIVPDGCMDLIVMGSTAVIAGADSTARTITTGPGRAVGLRFDPGVLPQLLRTSAAELANQVTPIAEVVTGVPSFRLGGSAGDDARELLDLAEALASRTVIDRRPLALARALAQPRVPAGSLAFAGSAGFAGRPVFVGSGAGSIAEVAADFAYSPRQLRRLSAEWFGYGPKHLAKILRWRSARELIAAGHTRASAAALAGYADAAHLWRDEQALLGR